MRFMSLFGVVFVSLALLWSPASSQSISKDTVDRVAEEISQLRKQIGESNKFVAERVPKIAELQSFVDKAPEDTEKMIADLELLVERFKAGSETATGVQKSMEEINVYIDRFREGSDAQKMATESLRKSLAIIKDSDAARDKLVGQALATIRKLKAQKDDLIALQIAGAYQQMAKVYKEMIGSFSDTVNSAEKVTTSIENAIVAPSE